MLPRWAKSRVIKLDWWLKTTSLIGPVDADDRPTDVDDVLPMTDGLTLWTTLRNDLEKRP